MEISKFFVKSGNQNFKDRQNDVFSALTAVEQHVNLPKNETEAMEVDNMPSHRRAKKNRKSTKLLRGQESMFKVPGLPPIRTRMPDYRRNPDRWTKYTLGNVSASDMSEASNTAAAMDFLKSRQEQNSPMEEDTQSRIKFTKSGHRRCERARNYDTDDEVKEENKSPTKTAAFGDVCTPIESPPVNKPAFVQNKLVMPEYVVGQKVDKPKKVRKPRQKVEKELILSHLTEDE